MNSKNNDNLGELKKERSYWTNHINIALESGESCKKYCTENNLSYQAFNKWKKKLGLINQPLKSSDLPGFEKIFLPKKKESVPSPFPCPKWTALFLKEFLK